LLYSGHEICWRELALWSWLGFEFFGTFLTCAQWLGACIIIMPNLQRVGSDCKSCF
jgi:hypothetical protein